MLVGGLEHLKGSLPLCGLSVLFCHHFVHSLPLLLMCLCVWPNLGVYSGDENVVFLTTGSPDLLHARVTGQQISSAFLHKRLQFPPVTFFSLSLLSSTFLLIH